MGGIGTKQKVWPAHNGICGHRNLVYLCLKNFNRRSNQRETERNEERGKSVNVKFGKIIKAGSLESQPINLFEKKCPPKERSSWEKKHRVENVGKKKN